MVASSLQPMAADGPDPYARGVRSAGQTAASWAAAGAAESTYSAPARNAAARPWDSRTRESGPAARLEMSQHRVLIIVKFPEAPQREMGRLGDGQEHATVARTDATQGVSCPCRILSHSNAL